MTDSEYGGQRGSEPCVDGCGCCCSHSEWHCGAQLRSQSFVYLAEPIWGALLTEGRSCSVCPYMFTMTWSKPIESPEQDM